MKPLLKNRLIILSIFIGVVLAGNKVATGGFLPSTETQDLWFYSGLFMLVFSTLFIEPYYSSPKNVITNTVPLILVFLAIEPDVEIKSHWLAIMAFLFALTVMALTAMVLADPAQGPETRKNKLSERLKNMSVFAGKAKRLYSGIFLFFLLGFYISDGVLTGYAFYLLIVWAAVMLIDPSELTNSFKVSSKTPHDDALGQVFGVQSKRIFLVKLFDDKKTIKKFDVVEFRYSMQDDDQEAKTGIVFDYYLLNQEKWAKVLELKTNKRTNGDKLAIDRFVGVVINGTTIGRLKFEYSKKDDDLQEGDLLELSIGKRSVYYQVVAGITENEKLEARNESGFIEGEALQLGEWDEEQNSFNKFGWLPQINTPIFKADTSRVKVANYSYPEIEIGTIPGTSLPSVLNMDDAISHHMAIIGITGSGKSHLAHQVINTIKTDTKIIIIDFTGEWKQKMSDHIILNKENIDEFLDSEDTKIGIVELPSLSNTVEVVQATEKLLSTVFSKAKAAYENGTPHKICMVLEEAHTIVPENNFLGVNNWDSKAVVNKMGQIALQGRKYGVGLLVIAQRTANVSKTVLTQCNTIVCFQAFDETSFNFLGNYVGKEMVIALPTLPKYHAIIAGKGVKSNIPMIVNLEKE